MPSLNENRLVEINDQIQAIQDLAETESRELTPGELDEINDCISSSRP